MAMATSGMRHVATILLLCVAAVACDAFTERELGVVIDGLCPAEIDVRSRYDTSTWGSEWELNGFAREDGIEFVWGVPPVEGVSEYILIHNLRDSNGDFLYGGSRTVWVDEGSIGRMIENNLEPRTLYNFRVFPVTADGLGFPTAPLEIWSLPERRPSAPVEVNASFENAVGTRPIGEASIEEVLAREPVGGWPISAKHVFLEPVSGMRVLRRVSGAATWQMVHDDVSVYQDRSAFFPGLGRDSWEDLDSDPNTDYEYAVCFGNAAGIGRAAIVDAIAERNAEIADMMPPLDIIALAQPYPVTVHWTPLSNPAVVGYELERQPADSDDIYGLRFTTSDRAENYVRIYVGVDRVRQSKFRVRAVTNAGGGRWSEWIAADIADAEALQEQTPKPEVVHLNATHNQAHLVWRTDDSLEGLKVRHLRRQVGVDEEFRAYDCWDWINAEDFDWDWACAADYVGFTDEYDVRPNTEYEYAVQTKRWDVVSPMSDPVSVRTTANPSTVERRPLPVYDLESVPTSDGVRLTWELPDDPTLKGILIWQIEQDHDINERGPPVVLPPDQTDYVALTRGYRPEPWRYWFEVETFNDYGTQAVGFQRVYASAPEMLHCRVTTEEVVRDDVGHHLTIRFRGCEEARTEVVRHELTADGFEVSETDQPCAWVASEPQIRRGFNYFEGTLVCEYVDASVKPGTWYNYELTQTLADGREFMSTHEVVTRPIYDAP